MIVPAVAERILAALNLIAVGAGVDLKPSEAMALPYTYSSVRNYEGIRYRGGTNFSLGLVVRFGNW